MTFPIAILSLLFTLCAACSNKESACDDAFSHMKKVSEKEMDTLPPDQKKFAQEIEAQNAGKEKDRRAKFIARCKEGGVDADCIMQATDTMGYVGCFTQK